MKYFLDSAKLDEIEFAYRSFGIDGVTTNPNHVMNSGKSVTQVTTDLAAWATEIAETPDKFPISIEIDPHLDDEKKMISEGERVAKISDYFVVKLPCTLPGLIASRVLEEKGIRTNVTLIFSPSQALAAARGKASFVSPFVGWKENSGEDCYEFLACIRKTIDNYSSLSKTEVIAAAIRNGKQIAEVGEIGLDIVTCGLSVYTESFEHPFTTYGLKKFQSAWDATKQ